MGSLIFWAFCGIFFDILEVSGCRGSSIFYDFFLGGRLFRWGRLFFFIVSSGGVAYFGGVVYSGLKSRELWIAKKRQPRVTMAFAHCSATTTIIVCVLCNV